MAWSDERVAVLKKMWLEGNSASEIAKELGNITRNAVIGKVHRLGLSNRDTNVSKAGVTAEKSIKGLKRGRPPKINKNQKRGRPQKIKQPTGLMTQHGNGRLSAQQVPAVQIWQLGFRFKQALKDLLKVEMKSKKSLSWI